MPITYTAFMFIYGSKIYLNYMFPSSYFRLENYNIATTRESANSLLDLKNSKCATTQESASSLFTEQSTIFLAFEV